LKKQIIVDRLKTLKNEIAVRKEKEKEKALHQKEKKIREMIFLFNNRFYNS
jgi:hypothetical protein